MASVVVCMATWYVIERTRLERPAAPVLKIASGREAFGVNVPRMITLTYGFGVALAGCWRRPFCRFPR